MTDITTMTGFDDIDWARLAFPQDDQYDSEVFARICEFRYGWKKTPPPEGVVTWLDEIEIIPFMWPQPNYVEAEPNDPAYALAEAAIIEVWPTQAEQFRRLINKVSGFRRKEAPPGLSGCVCGPIRAGGNPFFPDDEIAPDQWGNVYSTLHATSGYLEGIGHELGHWKGYALGVFIEDWERIIFANDPPPREVIDDAPCPSEISDEERAEWVKKGVGWQPLRPDKLRPIGALFQEIWICIYMMDLHLRMLPTVERGGDPNEATLLGFLDWAWGHVERTMKGHWDMCAIAEPVPGRGEAFWESYCSYTDRLYEEAVKVYPTMIETLRNPAPVVDG